MKNVKTCMFQMYKSTYVKSPKFMFQAVVLFWSSGHSLCKFKFHDLHIICVFFVPNWHVSGRIVWAAKLFGNEKSHGFLPIIAPFHPSIFTGHVLNMCVYIYIPLRTAAHPHLLLHLESFRCNLHLILLPDDVIHSTPGKNSRSMIFWCDVFRVGSAADPDCVLSKPRWELDSGKSCPKKSRTNTAYPLVI